MSTFSGDGHVMTDSPTASSSPTAESIAAWMEVRWGGVCGGARAAVQVTQRSSKLAATSGTIFEAIILATNNKLKRYTVRSTDRTRELINYYVFSTTCADGL